MKSTTCLSLLSLLSLTASLAAPVHAQSNNGHAIDSSFRRSLKSLGIEIALPKYVPQGFLVGTIKTKPCRAGASVEANGVCRFGPDYTVLYHNPQKNQCFAVEATGGGLGGPGYRYVRPVRTKLLGKVDVMIGNGNERPITAAIADTPQQLRTDYAGKSPFYAMRTIDSEAVKRISSRITCNDTAFMTPNEFIKVVQSLEFLP